MSKKGLLTLALLLITMFSSKVFAASYEDYDFTDAEIKYIIDFYGEDYDYLTDDDYNWIKAMDIDTNGYEIFDSREQNPTRTYVETTKKYIVASVSCSVNCMVTTKATWKSDPNVRSWDVIGARFTGSTYLDYASTTYVSSTAGSTAYSNYQYFANGFGNSVKLPSSGSSIVVTQKFVAGGSGRIYCSYQHSQYSISLATSQQYTIGAGSGNVFNFYGNASGKYDSTPGVYVDL